MYGHPDHIAISQLTTTAVMAAADPDYPGLTPDLPHRVAKLYYRAFGPVEQAAYETTFGQLVMPVDRIERRFTPWPEWAITTRIETSAYGEQVRQAVMCHRSQLTDYQKLKTLPEEAKAKLWGWQSYYRAMSLVNGGRKVEYDLFAGLRRSTQSQPLFYALPRFAAA